MLTYSNMQYKDLKEKAKKAGVRVTKDVRGKRVKLTAKELRAKIRLNFENSVKNAQQVIRVCRTIVGPGPQMTMRPSGVPPPPPPPPPTQIVPRKPPVNAKRAALMAELKNVLKKKGMNKNNLTN
jgi:hypothetical protein